MKRQLLAGIVALAGFGLSGVALADGQVTFDVKFSGHTDCYSPAQLDNVPISIKGTGVLNTDRSASVNLTLTAYYLLGWKYSARSELGDPPIDMGGGVTAAVRVEKANALSLILDFPDTTYTTTVQVDGKKCSAALVARPKTAEGIYDLTAGSTLFLCSRFDIEKSSCRVK